MVETNDEPQAEVPRRELRDPRALKAFAHPVRLQILEELDQMGQATATELAERIDESAANCSWHLRQLAKYGFIEEAGGGTGRQRPWKTVAQDISFGDPESPELELAVGAAAEVILEQELAAHRAWQSARRGEPKEWRKASLMSRSIDWLTADELAEFKKDYKALIERHVQRRDDPARRPPGARKVRIVTWGIPG